MKPVTSRPLRNDPRRRSARTLVTQDSSGCNVYLGQHRLRPARRTARRGVRPRGEPSPQASLTQLPPAGAHEVLRSSAPWRNRGRANPYVTIAIPTATTRRASRSCLRSALAQDYPADRIEILVADAMSMDATREIVLRIAGEDARVRMSTTRSARARPRSTPIVARGTRRDRRARWTRAATTADARDEMRAGALGVAGRAARDRAAGHGTHARRTCPLGRAEDEARIRGRRGARARLRSRGPRCLGAVRRRVFERIGCSTPPPASRRTTSSRIASRDREAR